MSRRARRMQGHHERKRATPGLLLVSLVDIFTILVFFLLVLAGTAEELPTATSITLPRSRAGAPPRSMPVVIVDRNDITVQGQRVASVAMVNASNEDTIAPLAAALAGHAETVAPGARAITIMGDRAIPYRLLRKIMATCVHAGFEHVALAVVEKRNGGTQ